jgi:hypothetical protein
MSPLSRIALLLCWSGAAVAQPISVTTPHLTSAVGDETVDFAGATFVNHGLVGVGRLSADSRDFAGETLGSFSSMTVDLASWRRHADGSYSGRIRTLPDRGPNDVGSVKSTIDYRNRINDFTIVLRPYAENGDLPQVPASQRQLEIRPSGGIFLTDRAGRPMTGKEPGSHVVIEAGVAMPSPAAGEGAGRISLDSEGLGTARDGTLYVSDEYAAGIYHFDRKGRLLGAIPAVSALLPRTTGKVDFNSVKPGDSGRRNNQGLEALTITPDGRHLVTMLQSATVQDSDPATQASRNNVRMLVYDIARNPHPKAPIGHYVVELPTYTEAGNGGAPDRTAAQSEMVALNDHQYLLLARDGIGRGAATAPSKTPVFKSVLLIDTDGATNLAGTRYETGTDPIAVGGRLAAGIVPVRQTELVDMLNPVQLRRFGMNLDTAPPTPTSLSEKQEAMGLLPALDPAAPDDYFLLIGNDNDFEAREGLVNGQTFDASLHGAHGEGPNDNVILVYRLTLPTAKLVTDKAL